MKGKRLKRTTVALSEEADKTLQALEAVTGICRSDLLNLAVLFFAAVFMTDEGRRFWALMQHVQRAHWRHRK